MKKVLFSLGVLGLFSNADAMLNVWSASGNQTQGQNGPTAEFAVVPVNSVSCSFDSSELGGGKKEGQNDVGALVLDFVPTGVVGNLLSKDVRIVVVPNHVRELPDGCFQGRASLKRISFRQNSDLERIGCEALSETGVEEVDIPDSVLELGYGCFKECKSLRQVTFGQGSKLELIGVDAFCDTPLEEVSIPDSVKELGDGCFDRCIHLRRVTFGPMSALEHIGHFAFSWTFIEEISIPDSVRKLENNCFFGCIRLKHVGFSAASQLEYIGGAAFTNALLRGAAIESVAIPDSVRELGYACFSDCPNLRCVSFGPNSQLELIGGKVFCNTQLEEIHIPGSVRELGESCFKNCTSLTHVAFSANSCLTWIGIHRFTC